MEKQMTFTIEMKETKPLFELLYMGLVVFHEHSMEKQSDLYDQVAEMLFKQYISITENIAQEDITDNQIAALREKQIDATDSYIEDYENTIFLEGLADRLTERYFIFGRREEKFKRYERMKKEILRALRFVGESIVEIRAPFLDEKADRFVSEVMGYHKRKNKLN